MKIAISAQNCSIDAALDPRFGRAKCFIVTDTETGEFSVHDNKVNLDAVQGAGIQTAKNVSDIGVEAVIAGNVGPKAFAVLAAAGIKVFSGTSGTVRTVIDAFRAGSLVEIQRANVEGHWM